MKTVAFVPIKLNNTRLPNKNTKLLSNGKPLCHYIFNTLLGCKEVDELYVYCSNEDIKEYIPDGIKFLKRDPIYDRQDASMNDLIKSFVNLVDADTYILTHVTAPLLKPESLDEGVRKIRDNGYDSAFAAKKIQDFMWQNGKPMNYDLNNIPRTQDLDPLYMETCGFFIFRKEVILNLSRRIGNNPYMVELDEIEALDVDEEVDFKIVDAVIYAKDKGII